MNNKILLTLAILLIGVGLAKPVNFNWRPGSDHNKPTVIEIVKPTNKDLLDSCLDVIKELKGGKADAKRLSSLYNDLALLVSLDGEDQVIKTTDEVRQANSLSGIMLRLDIKNKYKGLSSACNNVMVAAIGDDSVLLDKVLRNKAVDGFKALSWACNEASK